MMNNQGFGLSQATEITEQMNAQIKRFNALATLSDQVAQEVENRNSDILLLNSSIHSELFDLKNELAHINRSLSTVLYDKRLVALEFKSVLKQDSFVKLSRRVTDLKYEEFMSRDELFKLVEKK